MKNVIKERILSNGIVHIPDEILECLHWKAGKEIKLKIEGKRLVIESEQERKKLRIRKEIVDELVENEEFFNSEGI